MTMRRLRNESATSRLDRVVEEYIDHLRQRRANEASVRNIASVLRRDLVQVFGASTPLDKLDRRILVDRIGAVSLDGRPGAARELKLRSSVFLGWAASRGLIPANALAGFRLPRATKAENLARKGQALLTEEQIRILWRAKDTSDPVFTTYVRPVLLAGCRRTELARAQWSWVRELDGIFALVIPSAETKSGQAHEVPLPDPFLAMLRGLPRLAGNDLIFPGRNGRVISGWTKRWAAAVAKRLKEADLTDLTLHDLRRTARSWWARVGTADERTYE
jgi:integrase